MIVTLGTIALISILAVFIALAARGAGQRARHAESGEGALVLPLAAGNRDRHDDSSRVRSRSTARSSAASMLPGAARRAAHDLAVARQEPGDRDRRLVSALAPHAEHRLHRCCSSSILAADVHRHGAARAVLAVLLAVASVAGHPGEDLTWNAAPTLRIPRVRSTDAGHRRRAADSVVRAVLRERPRARLALLPGRVPRSRWPQKFGADKAHDRAVRHAADLGGGPPPRRPLRHVPPGDGVEGLRERRGAVPHASGRAAEDAPGREVRLHVLSRRTGLGGGHRGSARRGRALGGAAAQPLARRRTTRSRPTRARSCR